MHINNKGQAIVELAAASIFLSVLIFGMISAGLYIYDMSVYNYAANKALDKAIGITMSRNLTAKDISDIQADALNYTNTRVFASQPTPTLDTKTKGKIIVSITGVYNCNFAFFIPKPTISAQSTYIYKTK